MASKSAPVTQLTSLKSNAPIIDQMVGNRQDLVEIDRAIATVVAIAPPKIPAAIEIFKLALMLAKRISATSWATGNEGKIDQLVRVIMYGIASDKRWERAGTAADPLSKEPVLTLIGSSYAMLRVASEVFGTASESAAQASAGTASRHRTSRLKSRKSETNLTPAIQQAGTATPTPSRGSTPTPDELIEEDLPSRRTMDDTVPITPPAPASRLDSLGSLAIPPPDASGAKRTIR